MSPNLLNGAPNLASPPSHGSISLEDPVLISHMTCSDTTHVNATWRSYVDNTKYYNNTNINGACSGRGIPRYLVGQTGGQYGQVPYDWGGFDLPGQFNTFMDQGKQAGDINTAAVESCSKGVDCSGFVSRVWQYTTKYSTSTLPGISHAVSGTNRLVLWDIFNKVGSHTVLFIGFNGNGFSGTEATTTNAYDRVIYRYIDWTYINGYSMRRSNKLMGCWPT